MRRLSKKKRGDLTTYNVPIFSKDRSAAYELHVLKLTAGSYVIGSAMAGPGMSLSTNCFGAPLISVPAGKVVYLGDVFPFMNATLSDGKKLTAVGWAQNFAPAREALAGFQPALAERLENADIRNGATYACAATTMAKWELPGVPQLDLAAARVEEPVSTSAASPEVETVAAATAS